MKKKVFLVFLFLCEYACLEEKGLEYLVVREMCAELTVFLGWGKRAKHSSVVS